MPGSVREASSAELDAEILSAEDGAVDLQGLSSFLNRAMAVYLQSFVKRGLVSAGPINVEREAGFFHGGLFKWGLCYTSTSWKVCF